MLYYRKLLIEYRIPQELKFLTYLRYIICFKLWKKTVIGSCLNPVEKRKELEQIRFTVRKLTPPCDFMEQHQKYNWSNWPKLTISLNSSPDMINMDLKKVNTILYTANLSLKDCIKVCIKSNNFINKKSLVVFLCCFFCIQYVASYNFQIVQTIIRIADYLFNYLLLNAIY